MPNKRKAGKTKTTFWLTERQVQMLKALSEAEGLNMTETIQDMIEAYASYHNIRICAPEVESALKRKENKAK